MMFITLSVYAIFSIVQLVKYIILCKNHNYQVLEEAKKQLSSEFKTVFINSSNIVSFSKEMFKCQAKVSNDGKIICEIRIDSRIQMDSYEKFIEYFHFSEE